ncbi:hypothetical protein AVEN_195452-1 [Araneus ventricosus]|uniref:Uncharacterized protein n=1 Tax=Araneus ventricosus TaxID=182803 RepID=A0A4Y2VTK9_ARAVE|nr:hypothetical protein AVEN_195452-1 [Araneus ventricosus]
MIDSVGGAIGPHFQRCQVFHAHLQQLRIFEQRDPHPSQMESHKQDSSGVPIKSNRGSINQEIGVAKGLVHHAQSMAPQKCIHPNSNFSLQQSCSANLQDCSKFDTERVQA